MDLMQPEASRRMAAARIPDARLVMYPDGGHLWIGHDAELWRTVGAFVLDVEPG